MYLGAAMKEPTNNQILGLAETIIDLLTRLEASEDELLSKSEQLPGYTLDKWVRRAHRTEAKLAEIVDLDFFPACGDLGCMDNYEKIQAILESKP